jgi:hypothetical protein
MVLVDADAVEACLFRILQLIEIAVIEIGALFRLVIGIRIPDPRASVLVD